MSLRPTSIANSTPYKHVIAGQDDPTKDEPALTAAIAACHADGGGTVWVRDTMHLTSTFDFTSAPGGGTFNPVSLCGFNKGARIRLRGGERLVWGSNYDQYFSGTWYGINGPSNNVNKFSLSGAGPTINVGDYVAFRANDILPRVCWHTASLAPKSLEMHKVVYQDGVEYITDHMFRDVYTTSPGMSIVPMLRGVRIADLRIEDDGEGTGNVRAIDLSNCANFRIENCDFGDVCPGAVNLGNCADGVITGNVWGRNFNWNQGEGYGVLLRLCTNITIADNIIRGTRHAVTTGSSYSTASERRGTTLGMVVQDNTILHTGRDNGSHSALDTHSEGYGCKFIGNTVELGTDSTTFAFQIRSRAALLKGNTIRGGSTSKAGFLMGFDMHVMDNDLEDMWLGFAVIPLNGYNPENVSFSGNTYKDMASYGVSLSGGNNHTIKNETFIRTAHTGSPPTYPAAYLRVTTGNQHIIENNDLGKFTNTYSIYADVTNLGNICRSNKCRGYGTGQMGTGGTQAAGWQGFASENETD